LFRATILAASIAALVCVASASARLERVLRTQGTLTDPRVRVGTIRVPTVGPEARVIVTLKLPPLLAADLPSRAFASVGARHKVNFASEAARAYLARVDAAQRRARSGSSSPRGCARAKPASAR